MGNINKEDALCVCQLGTWISSSHSNIGSKIGQFRYVKSCCQTSTFMVLREKFAKHWSSYRNLRKQREYGYPDRTRLLVGENSRKCTCPTFNTRENSGPTGPPPFFFFCANNAVAY